jgi:hypothetical protein
MLLAGCLKDGIDPPAENGSNLELRFDFHSNGRPFSMDSLYTDGFGTLVRFDQVRFAIVGARLLGNEENQVFCDEPNGVFVADLLAPDKTVDLALNRTGEIHWMDTRPVRTTDRFPGLLDSLMVTGTAGSFPAQLDVRGVYDSDDNGRIDPTDQPFRIAVPANAVGSPLRIHAHTVVPPSAPSELAIAVNLTALLHEIDLPDDPITIGQGPYATQALFNFRTRVLGADNKPL